MNKILLGFLLLLVGLTACEEDKVTEAPDKEVKAIVLNEGGMSQGLAALSVIYKDGTSVFDIFRDVNNRPLGDIAQSITMIDGLYFIAINNSKKIEVVDPKTFESVATINYEQEGKPRFITPINDTEALVSDLNNQVVRINTKTFKVIEYIPVNKPIEKMVTIGNKIFGRSAGNILIFDIDKIEMGNSRKITLDQGIYQTAKLIVDKNGKLWALAAPLPYGTKKGALYCIDPTTEKVEYTFPIPFIKSGTLKYIDGCITGMYEFSRMDTDRTKSKLYFNVQTLHGETESYHVIYSFDVDTKEFKPYRELPGMEKNNRMIYGMGISPDGDVFVCDCLDYIPQRGYLRQYNKDTKGDADVNYQVGIYPRMVYFPEYDK